MALKAQVNADPYALAGPTDAYGPAGVGSGADALGELERIAANLSALAQVLEEVRAALNAHTHAGTAPALAGAEQASTPFTLS